MMVSYLISLSASQHDLETTVSILNIIGPGNVIVGSGNSTLYIVRRCRKSREDILTQLKALPSTQTVSVVQLSNPVKGGQLTAVKALFADFGLDAGSITDEDLALFINTRLHGQYTYYLNIEPGKRRGQTKISVRPTTKIPGYSDDWSKAPNPIAEEALDKVYTVKDFEVVTVELSTSAFDEPPPDEGEEAEEA